jgi:hypothetical protein
MLTSAKTHWGKLILLSLCLTACQQRVVPVLPATPTRIVITLDAARLAQTPQPPTWTPADTPTPIPTFTPYPSITPKPTLSQAALCEGFRLTQSPPIGQVFTYNDSFLIIWRNQLYEDIYISLFFKQSGQSTGTGVVFPSNSDGYLNYALNRLPAAGRYTWQVAVQHPVYGALCLSEGRITLLAAGQSKDF